MIFLALVISVITACEFSCHSKCSTVDCIHKCGCNETFKFTYQSAEYIFKPYATGEIEFIEKDIGCNLSQAEFCKQSLQNEEIYSCIVSAGCEQMLISEVKILNMDDTECIDTCTNSCKGQLKDKLDQCLELCLKSSCAGLSSDEAGTVSGLMNFGTTISLSGAILISIFGLVFYCQAARKNSRYEEQEMYHRLI
ncbi:unnamed protein product [Blepharisma stoltei]|uniref:Transmembrane protein n=1 Tax=Blepharisma stoltei TaxID=1481888 RepID=A0AAU9K2U9_9CILI|nr:unnamed protein product [Blepharisma stoltei]